MVMSALRSSSEASATSLLAKTAPIETPTRASRSPMMNGLRITEMIRSQRRRTSASPLGLTWTMANSSPPMRATVSVSRSSERSRSPTSGDELVAGIVAKRVVDLLEAVEVEHQQSDLLARAAIAGEGLGETVLEQRPVGEPGQLVVQRLVLGEASRVSSSSTRSTSDL